jgi:opacity protein-like surface antigen
MHIFRSVSRHFYRVFVLIIVLSCVSRPLSAQFLMDMVDTTKEMGKGVLSLYKRFDQVRISGYIQPQFQMASAEGAAGYSGGNFQEFSNSRFMIRRGRIRFDYVHLDEYSRPRVQFVFQFDGTERGVNIRDFWGRYWDHKWNMFHLTTGMFARPFGYEINLSSGDREAPERGRMSQILMKTERDLGVMVSFEPQYAKGFIKYLKIDAGVFNGQGLTGTAETDSYKDLITQALIKPVQLMPGWKISGGVSFLAGGMRQWTSVVGRMAHDANSTPVFSFDSTSSIIGDRLPRIYHGINAQLKWTNRLGVTEFRAERWSGTQTGTALTSETPAGPVFSTSGKHLTPHIRLFNGLFLLVLHRIGKSGTQFGLKYDSYDPNTRVSGSSLVASNGGFTAADVKYSTLGAGIIRQITENMKVVGWFEWVRNEKTAIAGLRDDLKDNVLTVRVQYRF